MARAGTCQVTSNLKHNWGQQTVTEQLVTIMSSDFLFLGIDKVNSTVPVAVPDKVSRHCRAASDIPGREMAGGS